MLLTVILLLLISVATNVNALEGLRTRHMREFSRKQSLNSGPEAILNADGAQYLFTPPEVGSEIYAGTIISLIPIVWATYEFTSRIRVQRNCLVCTGSGLTYVTRKGTTLNRPRKCWSCGGFIPWLGWRMFFLSTFTDPGNGGVLQRPSSDYEATNQRIRDNRKTTDTEGEEED